MTNEGAQNAHADAYNRRERRSKCESCEYMTWEMGTVHSGHGGSAYLVGGVRTPVGRYAGALSAVRSDDLAALVLHSLVEAVSYRPPGNRRCNSGGRQSVRGGQSKPSANGGLVGCNWAIRCRAKPSIGSVPRDFRRLPAPVRWSNRARRI